MTCFEIELSSRGYELDAEGFVPVHVLLRYMEHLRWEHAIRGVPEVVAMVRGGHAFVVVAQTLCVVGDIGVATPIRGTLWNGSIGRTSIVFRHALHRGDNGELFAAGSATLVHLARNGAPTLLRDCFGAPDADPYVIPDLNPQEFAEIPATSFNRSYRVRTGDLDFMRHMNQSNYAALFEDTLQVAAAGNAYGPGGPAIGRVRYLHIEYLHSAQLNDELVIATWPVDDAPCALGFAMHRNDTLLCRAVMKT